MSNGIDGLRITGASWGKATQAAYADIDLEVELAKLWCLNGTGAG
jgi:hypothetical protein